MADRPFRLPRFLSSYPDITTAKTTWTTGGIGKTLARMGVGTGKIGGINGKISGTGITSLKID
jgi:hypothetical protein